MSFMIGGKSSAPSRLKMGTLEIVYHNGDIPLKPNGKADLVGAHNCGAKIIFFDLLCCERCGFTWRYTPGSGLRRGMTSTGRPLCGRPECEAWENKTFMHQIENMEKGRYIGANVPMISVPCDIPSGAQLKPSRPTIHAGPDEPLKPPAKSLIVQPNQERGASGLET